MNLQTNKRLIRMAQRDGFHFLAIGKDDDAPLSQTHMEARILENLGNGMNKKQFQIVPGVDQLGLTLVTRAINEIRGDKPAVYPLFAPGTGGSTVPLYTDESAENSVHNQIIAIGGKIASSTKKQTSSLQSTHRMMVFAAIPQPMRMPPTATAPTRNLLPRLRTLNA